MKKNFYQFLIFISVCLYYLSGSVLIPSIESIAFAKDTKNALEPKEASQQKQDTKKGDEAVNVKQQSVETFLEALEFFGRVEKPQTVFIIPGKDPKVDDISIDRRFFKEIFRVVEKSTLKTVQSGDAATPYILY